MGLGDVYKRQRPKDAVDWLAAHLLCVSDPRHRPRTHVAFDFSNASVTTWSRLVPGKVASISRNTSSWMSGNIEAKMERESFNSLTCSSVLIVITELDVRDSTVESRSLLVRSVWALKPPTDKLCSGQTRLAGTPDNMKREAASHRGGRLEIMDGCSWVRNAHHGRST